MVQNQSSEDEGWSGWMKESKKIGAYMYSIRLLCILTSTLTRATHVNFFNILYLNINIKNNKFIQIYINY